MKKTSIIIPALLLTPVAWGQIAWTEQGEAGELIPTAQTVWGPASATLDSISGTLSDLDPSAGGTKDDIDLYRIRIVDVAAFSVDFSGILSVDNDTSLWLFDANGSTVLSADNGGDGFEPAFHPGAYAAVGGSPGVHFLGLVLYATSPNSDPLAGWNRAPNPFQHGTYQLTLTGAAPVPEPSEWLAIAGLGLAAFAGYRRLANRGR